ncbi:MAG: hypothetical protein ACRDAM_11060, partial [Casimicrobium sp.]
SAVEQNLLIRGNWAVTPASSVGRAATSVGTLAPGFRVATHLNAASNILRQPQPTTAAATSTSSSATQLTGNNVAPFISLDTNRSTVFTGYMQIATAGLYQVSAPALGGNVDVYVGDVWITGSRDNRWPVAGEPDPNNRDEAGKIWLKAGTHPVKVVFGREALHQGYGDTGGYRPRFWLRIAAIDAQTNPFVNIFRTP